MINRFESFDGDANLFSGLNEDGDKFVLLRSFKDYETSSEFVFIEDSSWPNEKIKLGEGNDSVLLMDSDGMFIEFYGDRSQINSLFNSVPKPIIEETKQKELEENIVEYVMGPIGPKGEQGYAGADGRDGADGKDGLPGQDGDSGQDGKDGIDGIGGIDGLTGQDGIDGKDGIDGTNGADGLPGESGKDGKDGTDGLPGEDGKDGTDGLPGEDGKDGVDGKDGKNGERGEQGILGTDGKDGVDGKTGLPGKDGLHGTVGPQGERGETGDRGEKGDTGDSGVASTTYPLKITEDGILTLDKKFIEQLAGKGGKVVMQGGGGNLTAVMSDGSTVNKDARHINFTGQGVNVTKGNRGQVNISIPGGDADGGFTASSQIAGQVSVDSHFVNTATGELRLISGNSIDISSSTSGLDDVIRFTISVDKAGTPTIGPAIIDASSAASSSGLVSESYLNAFAGNFGKEGGQLVDGGEL